MEKNKKIYGAFTYNDMKDRVNKQWGRKDVANTLLEINKKAIELLKLKNVHSVDIMVYEPKKMAWSLVSSKMKSNMK